MSVQSSTPASSPSVPGILVLFAHPSQNYSEVNVSLFDIALKHRAVTAVDLYAEYPDFNINVKKEQNRLLAHDTIIFLFPLYWFSTPALLKEWQDLVLEYGFAYGKGGNALKDKTFICAVSAGGREEAYQTAGYNHYTLRELLQPLEQLASTTQMQYLAPFAIFGSRTAKEERRIALHCKRWQALLDALANGILNINDVTQLENLAHYPGLDKAPQ